MQELFKATNNEVDEFTTKYFARAMQKQYLDSLIANLGAEIPSIDSKPKQKEEKKADGKYEVMSPI